MLIGLLWGWCRKHSKYLNSALTERTHKLLLLYRDGIVALCNPARRGCADFFRVVVIFAALCKKYECPELIRQLLFQVCLEATSVPCELFLGIAQAFPQALMNGVKGLEEEAITTKCWLCAIQAIAGAVFFASPTSRDTGDVKSNAAYLKQQCKWPTPTADYSSYQAISATAVTVVWELLDTISTVESEHVLRSVNEGAVTMLCSFHGFAWCVAELLPKVWVQLSIPQVTGSSRRQDVLKSLLVRFFSFGAALLLHQNPSNLHDNIKEHMCNIWHSVEASSVADSVLPRLQAQTIAKFDPLGRLSFLLKRICPGKSDVYL